MTLDDVSEELPVLEDSGLERRKEDVVRWTTDLIANRVIVLCSASPDVRRSALLRVARSEHFLDEVNQRFLHFRKARDRSRAAGARDLQLLPEDFALCLLPSPQREPTLVVVEAAEAKNQWARSFLDDLFGEQDVLWRHRQADLRRLDRYVVVLTEPDMLMQRDHRASVPCHRLDFAETLLLRHTGGDVAHAKELLARLEAQRQQGRWGDTEQGYHDALLRRVENARGSDDRLLLPDTDEPAPTPSNDILIKICHFTATYFPAASTQDFHEIVALIAEGENELVTGIERAKEAETKKNKNKKKNGKKAKEREEVEEEGREVKSPAPLDLGKRWKLDSTQLLEQAGLEPATGNGASLTLARSEGGAQPPSRRMTIAFADLSQRHWYQRHFIRKDHYFLLRIFDQLRAARFLFHSSEEVVAGFVSLAVEVAASNPERYGHQWVLGMLVAKSNDKVEITNTSLGEILRAFIQQFRDHHEFHNQLYVLFRGMLSEPSLVEVVERALSVLVTNHWHVDCLEVVRRLANVPSFDALRWIRSLFEHGKQELQPHAFRQLRHLAGWEGNRQLETLLVCRSWCGEHRELRSAADLAAIQLLVSLCELSLHDPRPLCGQMRSRDRFFVAAVDRGDEALLGSVLRWFIDPRVQALLRGNDRWGAHLRDLLGHWVAQDPQILGQTPLLWEPVLRRTDGGRGYTSEYLLPAIVIADCALGRQEGLEDSTDTLLRTIVSVVPKHTWRKWMEIWDTLGQCLGDVDQPLSARIDRLHGEDRQRAKQPRARIRSLRNDLKKLHGCLRSHGREAKRIQSCKTQST